MENLENEKVLNITSRTYRGSVEKARYKDYKDYNDNYYRDNNSIYVDVSNVKNCVGGGAQGNW